MGTDCHLATRNAIQALFVVGALGALCGGARAVDQTLPGASSQRPRGRKRSFCQGTSMLRQREPLWRQQVVPPLDTTSLVLQGLAPLASNDSFTFGWRSAWPGSTQIVGVRAGADVCADGGLLLRPAGHVQRGGLREPAARVRNLRFWSAQSRRKKDSVTS